MFAHMNGQHHIGGQEEQDQVPPPQGFFLGHLGLWSFIGVIVILGSIITGIALWNKSHPHPDVAVALWCKPNATVSLDGQNGAFPGISEAVKAAPTLSSKRFCIHIKGGNYTESVLIGFNKTNLVFVGDGAGKTVLAANQTCRGPNCQRATLLVRGAGFIAVDLAVVSTEEPENVTTSVAAVENRSDRSIFYRCSLRGSHDVLRAYERRQFYRDTEIQGGSGSLVYGGAKAFFQNCSLAINGGSMKKKNVTYVVAEQSVKHPSFKGGFTFHLTNISAAFEVPTSVLLGAARTPYSSVSYLECRIDLQAAAWSTNGFLSKTVFFALYKNTRFGSPWNSSSPDVRILNFSEASQLSLGGFFAVDWLPRDIPHKRNLGR